MVEAADADLLYSRHKAITALFPYAAQQEQSGEHEMLNTFLQTARALQQSRFTLWHRIELFVASILNVARPASMKLVAILASPHLPWATMNSEHLIEPWAAAALAITYTDNIGQAIVDTLLQVASDHSLQPFLPPGIWSLLKKHPLLPPACMGRCQGSTQGVLQAVRALENLEILKSYLLLIWSEWDHLFCYAGGEMCASIRTDFSGIGMEHHRKDLLQQLDLVLGQLDLGLGHLQQHKSSLDEFDIWLMKEQYGDLKEVLLNIDKETINTLTRKPSRLAIIFSLLTLLGKYRNPLKVYMCTSPPVLLAVLLDHSLFISPIHNSSHQLTLYP